MLDHWRYQKRCQTIAQRFRQAGLADYLTESAALEVDTIANTPLIAVDLEMTGLDARENQIVAIGWTHVDGGRIRFAANQHLLINAGQTVGYSAAIHELLDSDVAHGVALEEGLATLFEAARGRVWLFHHASLDVGFLQRASISWAGFAMPFMVLDTLQMELSLRQQRDLPVQHDDLRLNKLRAHYNLPAYTAHNALTDASSTAELLLAIAEKMEPATALKLKPYLTYF